MEQRNEKSTRGRLVLDQTGAWRSSCALLTVAALFFTSGCGSVGKTVGIALAATGGAAAVTTGFLGAGCTTPNPNNPHIEDRGPCMPLQTYEEHAPIIWTTFVMGIILMAAGVAVYVTATEPPKNTDPGAGNSSSQKKPIEDERCTDAKYCY